jgi:hypothetical protein
MQGAGSSKPQVLIYQSKQNYIPDYCNHNIHHCDNLKSHSVKGFDNGIHYYI